MNPNRILRILALVTLVQMMVTIGLSVKLTSVIGVARDWRLVFRSVLANYICVPAIAVGLLLLVHASPMIAAGFIIVAVCPGAPYGPPFTAMARGNMVAAVGLMVILAGSSAILAPVLLQVLAAVPSAGEPLRIDAVELVGTLAVSQFIPLCVGLYLRQHKPALADRLRKPFTRLSTLLNVLFIGSVLVLQFSMIANIHFLGYLAMLTLVAASAISGWLAGGPGGNNRKTLAIVTSVRNVGVAFVIVTASFPGTPAVTAATAYGVFQTIVLALVALAWGRLGATQPSPIQEAKPA